MKALVSQCVLREETVEDRVCMISQFTKICVKLIELHNFNSAMPICSGLHTSSVYRLRKTFAALPVSITSSLEDIQALLSAGTQTHTTKKTKKLKPPNN